MLIQEVFDQLRYGELSQVGLVDADTGVIPTTKHAALLGHLQMALTALHKRFKIREERDTITLTGVVTYALPDDLLRLEQVMTAEGKPIAINEEDNPYSVFTPKLRTLRLSEELAAQGADLPDELKTASLQIVYRANHPAIDVEDFDLEETEVELPETYLEPLLFYIAARVHNPIGSIGQSNEGQVGISWSARYEQACQDIEQMGLQPNTAYYQDRLSRNGWA